MKTALLNFFKRFKNYPNYFSNNSDYEIKKIEALSKKINITFTNPSLYIKALTHRSYLELSNDAEKSNERLEFLGDSILGVLVAEYLFRDFPDEDEGFLTKTRSHIVDKHALAEAAERIDLSDFILYDSRFIKSSDKGIKTISADCFEALIGAIYLDCGLEDARKFVSKWIIKPNLKSGKYQIDKNYKGQLLEFTHANNMSPPEYVLIKEEGPDHNKIFSVRVIIDGETTGIGEGRNKKTAEQNAAKNSLSNLNS